MLHIGLDTSISKRTANKALGIKDGVLQRFKDISKKDMLEIRFDSWTNNFTPGQNKVTYMSIHGCLTLGGITDNTFSLGESNVRWSRTVTLVVGNDFHAIILPDTDTTVGRTEIDTYTFSGY
jgi:hypothetical protein